MVYCPSHETNHGHFGGSLRSPMRWLCSLGNGVDPVGVAVRSIACFYLCFNELWNIVIQCYTISIRFYSCNGWLTLTLDLLNAWVFPCVLGVSSARIPSSTRHQDSDLSLTISTLYQRNSRHAETLHADTLLWTPKHFQRTDMFSVYQKCKCKWTWPLFIRYPINESRNMEHLKQLRCWSNYFLFQPLWWTQVLYPASLLLANLHHYSLGSCAFRSAPKDWFDGKRGEGMGKGWNVMEHLVFFSSIVFSFFCFSICGNLC